jgi:outer membrane protein
MFGILNLHNTYMKPIRLLIFALVLIHANPLLAQQAPLTYQEALKIALRSNFAVQQQQNNQHAQVQDRASRYASLLPSVTGDIGAQQISGRQFDLTTGRLDTRTSERASAGLDVIWTVFNGASRIHAIKESHHALKAGYHEVERVKQQLLMDVSNAFFQVLLDQELLKIAQSNLEAQRVRATRVNALVSVGQNLSDEALQVAEVSAAEMALIQAEAQLEIDKIELARLIQWAPGSDFTVQAPVGQSLEPWEQSSLDDLLKQSMQYRPDYLRLQELQKATHYAYRASRGRLLPIISLGYQYGSGYSSFQMQENPQTGTMEVVPIARQFTDLNVYNVAFASMRIPLFNGLQNRNQIALAKASYQNSTLDVEAANLRVDAETRSAWIDLQAARKRTEASKAREEAMAKALDQQKKRYETGSINLVELTTVNNNYLEATSQAAQAYYSYLLRQATLSFRLGNLDVQGK